MSFIDINLTNGASISHSTIERTTSTSFAVRTFQDALNTIDKLLTALGLSAHDEEYHQVMDAITSLRDEQNRRNGNWTTHDLNPFSNTKPLTNEQIIDAFCTLIEHVEVDDMANFFSGEKPLDLGLTECRTNENNGNPGLTLYFKIQEHETKESFTLFRLSTTDYPELTATQAETLRNHGWHNAEQHISTKEKEALQAIATDSRQQVQHSGIRIQEMLQQINEKKDK